jgi:hypothetical protein
MRTAYRSTSAAGSFGELKVKKYLSILIAATFVTAAVPAISVVTATGAHAWPKSKKCTDWCTNRSTGQKFRIRR